MRFSTIKILVKDDQEDAKLNKYMTLSDLTLLMGIVSIVCILGLFLPDIVWKALMAIMVLPLSVLIIIKNTFLKKGQLENYVREKSGFSKKRIFFDIEG